MATILRTKIKKTAHSIRWKIVFAYLLIILIAFAAVAVSLIQLVGDYMFTQRVAEDQRIAESLAEQFSTPLASFDALEMQSIVNDSGLTKDMRILVLDSNGIVQLDSNSILNGTIFENSETSEILGGRESAYGIYDLGSSSDFWIKAAFSSLRSGADMSGLYAHCIEYNGSVIGTVIYINSVQDIYASLHTIQLRLLILLLLVTLITVLISMMVMRKFTQPINELSSGIERMTAGDLSARVTVSGKNEFSDLATAFNSMSEKLEALDSSRSQFVSNASHELKTPLSTIKILIETLLYQDPIDPGMTKEFLGDVNNEINRLSSIISDLLTLVNIDSGGMTLNAEQTDLNALLDEQIKRLQPLARENGIEIDLETRDTFCLTLDKLKMQQVIYNVIDNAIKYTPRGGTVKAALFKSGKKVILTITDTGIGIPEADLPHIFDRFYRVDKARSRETGGTGLGLSIVREIVQLHGGNITAISAEGKGTTFRIELPPQ